MFAINPGTGPLAGACENVAYENMRALLRDVGHDRVAVIRRDPESKDEGGRFSYFVKLGDRECAVDMPGIALDRVRYTGADDQNIWDFPRLYVDGSSWVWKFAVSRLREALERTEE